MKIYSVNVVPGNYEVLGMVKGSTVQTRNVFRDVMAGFRTIVGGEVKSYSEMLVTARVISEERMIEEAKKLGADAIIAVNYITSSIVAGSSEILVYGTAIKYI